VQTSRGAKQLLSVLYPKVEVTGKQGLVGSITLPQIYQEAEDVATFIDDLLEKLAAVVNDTAFNLQFPTCIGCDPPTYMDIDNTDLAAVLAYIGAIKAGLETILAYTPGDLFMDNLEFDLYADGIIEAVGWETIVATLKDSFQAAQGNGILDLNGSGDGDAAAGYEVLPATCLTLRDGQWLQSAKANLLQSLAWLKTAIQGTPVTAGEHDPPIDWPLEMYWPWSENTVSVSKADLIGVVDTIEEILDGPTVVDIDIDLDGIIDHSTTIDLSTVFDTPIQDLKALLPDLLEIIDTDDPLFVISTEVDGNVQYWKIDGTLNSSTERVSINFVDPTLGGILPNGDANDVLAMSLFGHVNPSCQNISSFLNPAAWHMITLPGELCGECDIDGTGDLVCALSDDLDPCYIFQFNPATGGYVMAPPTEKIPYHPGMGFWVRTYEDNITIDADVQVPTQQLQVPLANGWNQIGNPFTFSVPVSEPGRCASRRLG